MNAIPSPVPGACYKFVVRGADEAASLIRERLGPQARVLSVRTVEASGLSRLWASPRLEVVVQVSPATSEGTDDSAPPGPSAAPASADPGVVEFPKQGEAPAVPPAPRKGPPPVPALARSGTRSLGDLLRRSGLSELALERLQSAAGWEAMQSAPLHRALAEAGQHLRREAGAGRSHGALTRAAFLGAPGVGRTTALCKWLGMEVFRRGRMGHVVSVEFDRPNPAGPLPVFCEALGIPLAHFPAATRPAVPGGFVYFDLPGISARDASANAAVAAFLERERIEQRVLVLNAAYDHAALRAAYAAGRSLGATHLVLTHLDEVSQWGRLWDYLVDGALEPLFLATGPSLTGDCEEQVVDALVRRTLAPAPGSAGGDETAEPPAAALRSLGTGGGR